MALLFFGGRFLKRKRKDLLFLPFPPSLSAGGGGGKKERTELCATLKWKKNPFDARNG